MHVARGPSSHCGSSPVHPWVPLLVSPIWFYIDSLKLPVHGHMYIEQSAQRTLKVAHSLWFTQSQIRVPKLGTGVLKIRRMGFLEQWKSSLIKLTSLPNMLKVSKSHVVQCVPVQTQIVTCILVHAFWYMLRAFLASRLVPGWDVIILAMVRSRNHQFTHWFTHWSSGKLARFVHVVRIYNSGQRGLDAAWPWHQMLWLFLAYQRGPAHHSWDDGVKQLFVLPSCELTSLAVENPAFVYPKKNHWFSTSMWVSPRLSGHACVRIRAPMGFRFPLGLPQAGRGQPWHISGPPLSIGQMWFSSPGIIKWT